MEQKILEQLAEQQELLQKIQISTEKTRKYLAWTFYGSIALFVLPLLGLMFAIPALLSNLSTAYGI